MRAKFLFAIPAVALVLACQSGSVTGPATEDASPMFNGRFHPPCVAPPALEDAPGLKTRPASDAKNALSKACLKTPGAP